MIPPFELASRIKQSNFRPVFKLVAPHRGVIVSGTLLSLLSTTATLSMPLVVKSILDQRSGNSAVGLASLLVLIVAASALAQYWQDRILGVLAADIIFESQKTMLERIYNGTIRSINQRPIGEFVSRITSDTALLRHATSTSLVNMVCGCTLLVGSIAIMAALDAKLLIIAFISLIFVYGISVLLLPGVAKYHFRAQESIGRLASLLESGLRAIKTVKSSNSAERETGRGVLYARVARNSSVQAVKRESLIWTVATFGIHISIIGILGFGAHRVSDGTLALSTLVAFLMYAIQIVEPISMVTQSATQLQSGVAAASRIAEITSLDQEPIRRGRPANENQIAEVHSNIAGNQSILELQSVTFRYPYAKKCALLDVSLSVARRGHTAIVGPTGAGKTTILSLILGFEEPETGRLLIEGSPYGDTDLKEIRSRISYVEQETPIIIGTIRENLTLGCGELRAGDIEQALRKVVLLDKVCNLPEGIDSELDSSELSGGERQRIAIARALLRKPDILLLDEATSQLDGITESLIREIVRGLSSEIAVVTIAHRLSTVIHADKIIVLEDGKVRSEGHHVELFENDSLYREMVLGLATN